MVSQGERPLYRLRVAAAAGSAVVATSPDLPIGTIEGRGRLEVVDAARARIADLLEVPPEAIDLRVEEDRRPGDRPTVDRRPEG